MEPEQGHRHEPEQHDGTEDTPDRSGATALDHEQQGDQCDGQRQNVGGEHIGGQREPFDRAQDRNGRCNDAVAIKKRHADQPERDDHIEPFAEIDRAGLLAERHERQHAAFPLVVGFHHEQQIFHGDDEHERPHDHGQDPQHVVGSDRQAMRFVKTFAQGIQRAGSDVAVDHSHGGHGEGEGRRLVVEMLRHGYVTGTGPDSRWCVATGELYHVR